MENNTNIIVLTSVIIVLIVFIIATVREFNTSNITKIVKKEGGPRAEMMRLIGKLFTDDRIDAGKKITFMNAVKPIIEDLISDEEKMQKAGDYLVVFCCLSRLNCPVNHCLAI